MGIVNKLKEILFDEVTTEIPVITKEEKEEKPETKRTAKKNDDIIVTQIEKKSKDDDLFDMPKLKEEAKEEVHSNSFTFPVIDDDLEIGSASRVKKKVETSEEKPKPRQTYNYDVLSSTSYKPKQTTNKYSKEEKTKKPFTPSPIISPVWGVLNENYKEEDIVTKKASPTRSKKTVDLDSVRKKAYGSLEEEIDNKLKTEVKAPEEEEVVQNLEELSDDGITITDLLVDNSKEDVLTKEDDKVIPEVDEAGLGEDDLFDLIDSLSNRKDD